MSGNYVTKENTADGALFFRHPNDKTSPNAPDYSGQLNFDIGLVKILIAKAKAGEPLHLDIACWKKMSKKGDAFFSVTVQNARQRTERRSPPKQTSIADDDLPF